MIPSMLTFTLFLCIFLFCFSMYIYIFLKKVIYNITWSQNNFRTFLCTQ
ncbi:hypothetical protein BU064_12245 [Staphylococcus succinus]|nr:hypothetical protein BU064_12245 [Staphylococcus succinus]